MCTGGISNFFSQLIVGFGYTPEESLLYGTPGGAVEIVALIVCGWAGDKYAFHLSLLLVQNTVANSAPTDTTTASSSRPPVSSSPSSA